jgi:mannosyltransferase
MGAVDRVRAFTSSHALGLLIALGAVIRFATIDSQGFWLDEQVTVSLVQQSPIDLLRSVVTGESNPSLYYLLQAGWERIFGSDELGIRSFTALLGTAAIPFMYGATKALFSRRAGLIAAAFTAASPLLIWYSQEARNYEQLLLLSAVALYCFARALADHGHRWLWGWALAAALALGTHYFAAFVLVPEAFWLFVRRRRERADVAFAFGTIAVVALALLPLAATQRGRGDWIGSYSFSGRLLNVPEQFLTGYQVPWEVVPTLAIVVTVLALLVISVRAEPGALRAMAIPATVAVGGLALVVIAAAFDNDYLLTRNVIGLWPPAAAAIAIGLAAPRLGRAGPALATAVCVIGTGLAVWNAATPDARRPSYDELARALGSADQPRLIVSQSSFSSPLVLYADNTHPATDEELTTQELVVVKQRPATDYAVGTCFWVATCGGVDVEPPPPFDPPAGFELQRTATTDEFEYSVYEADRPLTIPRPTEYFTPRVFAQAP